VSFFSGVKGGQVGITKEWVGCTVTGTAVK